jgi:hypothetical protein
MHCFSGLIKNVYLQLEDEKKKKFINKLKNEKILIDFPRNFNISKIEELKSNQIIFITLYYFYIFKNFVSDNYYEILVLFNFILKFLLSKNEKKNLKIFEEKITLFQEKFKNIFKKLCCTNYHNTIHFKRILEDFGFLLFNNLFCYESFNGFIQENFYHINLNKSFFEKLDSYDELCFNDSIKKKKNFKNFKLKGLTFNIKNEKNNYNSYTIRMKDNKIAEIIEFTENNITVKEINSNIQRNIQKNDIKNQIVVCNSGNDKIYSDLLFNPKFIN